MVEREEVVKEAVVKEFEAVHDKYRELLATLVELKVSRVIDPVACKYMKGLLDIG